MSIIDQVGNKLILETIPQKIVSLVPSQTELLCDLGLSSKICGRTKFCIHPNQEVKRISNIGGTKNIHIDRILAMNPDLIIANKEENTLEDIQKLREHNIPVWTSQISTWTDAIDMIHQVGIITGTEEKSLQLIEKLNILLQNWTPVSTKSNKVLYLIWNKPAMSVGSDTFIHHMLETIGLDNVMKAHHRYPTLVEEEMLTLNPDFIFLSSEPFPFKPKHIKDFKAIWPNANIILVDGELFSWYGSRLLKSFEYFESLKPILHD